MPLGQRDTKKTTVTWEIMFWLFLFLVIAFLRLPSFSDSFYDPDVAATAYSAQLFAEGSCIYPDAVETKPPGSYAVLALLFAISRNMAWVHMFMVFYHLAVSFLLYRILSEHTSKVSGRLAALLYGAYSACGFVNGYAPNFETWAILPLAAAFLYSRKGEDSKASGIFLAGIFCGLATLMKQQAVIVAFFLWLGFLTVHTRKRANAIFKYSALFILGGLIPWAIVLLYFGAKGCAGDLFTALNPTRNLSYITSNRPDEILLRAGNKFWMFARHTWLLLVASLFGLILPIQRKFVLKEHLFLVFWVTGALIAVCAGTKFYGHYFHFLIPPLAVLGGRGIYALLANFPKKYAITFFLSLFSILCLFNLHRELNLSWLSMKNIASGKGVSSGELFRYKSSLGPDWFENCVGINHLEWEHAARMTGQYIEKHTSPTNTIWVYDYLPSVYWHSKRFAPTPHFMNFEISYDLSPESGVWYGEVSNQLKKNRRELLEDLSQSPPKFIVKAKYDNDVLNDQTSPLRNEFGDPMTSTLWRTPLFQKLENFLRDHYKLDDNAPDVPLEIWKLVMPPTESANPHGQIPSN